MEILTDNQVTSKEFDNFLETTPNKELRYFWLGFMLSTLNFTWMSIANTQSNLFIYFQFIGLLVFVTFAVKLIQLKIANKYLAGLFYLMTGWSLIVIGRGIAFDKDSIINMLIDTYGGIFMYLAPFIMLFPLRLIDIQKLFNTIVILGIAFLLFSFLQIDQLIGSNSSWGQQVIEYNVKYLAIPAGFLLLLNSYQSDKRMILSITVILVSFILAVIRARRGLIFMSTNIIIFSFIFYFMANRGNILKRYLPLVLLPILLYYAAEVYFRHQTDTFSYINQRMDEDTRSGVETFFFLDMNLNEWIIGKGINGQYYCPIFDDSVASDFRSVIETDYLQIILKGGLVRLLLLLLIAIPAVIKGIFHSQNKLSKAAGLWILFWIVNLYPSSVTLFSLNYLMVWICIGICYSKEIRSIPEETIKEFFKANKDKLVFI